MRTNKHFCLKCLMVNACKCGTDEYQFMFTHKIRPPTIRRGKVNKAKWQQFLVDCPQFINRVPEHLYELFNDFIFNKVKFTGETINGQAIPLEVKVDEDE